MSHRFSNFSTIFLLFNASVVVFALNTLLFQERAAESATSSIIFGSLTVCATGRLAHKGSA
jgi:hypothetical protein